MEIYRWRCWRGISSHIGLPSDRSLVTSPPPWLQRPPHLSRKVTLVTPTSQIGNILRVFEAYHIDRSISDLGNAVTVKSRGEIKRRNSWFCEANNTAFILCNVLLYAIVDIYHKNRPCVFNKRHLAICNHNVDFCINDALWIAQIISRCMSCVALTDWLYRFSSQYHSPCCPGDAILETGHQ